MKISVKIPLSLYLAAFLIAKLFLLTPRATAATYYLATDGSNADNGSFSAPWASFSYAIPRLQPGDLLVVKNGTYYQSVELTVSGTSDHRITIRAQNDGGATIDGEFARPALRIDGRNVSGGRVHDWSIEGIVFKNSSESVVTIYYADRITCRRVSAYNAGDGNNHIFEPWYANDILIEDCIASGSGRFMVSPLRCKRVIVRRLWAKWQSHTGERDEGGILQFYGSDDCIAENIVATMNQDSDYLVSGLDAWANSGNESADRNQFLGNIILDVTGWAYANNSRFHRTEGNIFENNVAVGGRYGYGQRGDADARIRNMTTLVSDHNYWLNPDPASKDSDYEVRADIRNSIALSGDTGFYVSESNPGITSLTNDYNNIYDVSSPYSGLAQKGPNDTSMEPEFDVTTYGTGAYLRRPANLSGKGENTDDVGAEVLYRYVDGELKDGRNGAPAQPLWPWPMEERVLRETGSSATWAAQGGLWKTLDNVYPEDLNLGDNEPPSPPTGLRVQINPQ